jgi:23S rRNA (cytidine1920-2'-O)/16S rRNA (cytidine1409-2'-O)-methyltransferase
MKKIRLDKLLVDHGLAPTVEKAQALILARTVKVNDEFIDKAGALISAYAEIQIKGNDNPYVSRGGLKLRGALNEFAVDVQGLVVFDVGASTGGFTDCLLHAGAQKVYALDVSYGQFAWKLREDKRVVVIERTNIRYYDGADFTEQPDFATIDVSFISLGIVLPAVIKLLKDNASILALIKPQFEAAREEIGNHGVVTDSHVHERIVQQTIDICKSTGMEVIGTCESALLGPEGNKEFFILAKKTGRDGN